MNQETFEQTFLGKELISAPDFLKEGQIVDIAYHEESESFLSCDLPAAVVLEITYTEPGEKGNTATNVMKDATVETGANVKVPLFINIGDLIKVDTRSGEYSERVKA
jgi:elongation factor P